MKLVLNHALLLVTIFPFLFVSCNKSSEKSAEIVSPNIDTLYQDYFKFTLKYDPIEATRLGYAGYNHLFVNNISDNYLTDKKEALTRWEEKLDSINVFGISDTDKDNINLLKYMVKIELEGLDVGIQPGTIYTLHPIHSYHRSTHHEFVKLARGTGSQPFKTAEDYDNFLARLKGFNAWLQTAQKRMEQAIAEKKPLPKKIVAKMIPQFNEWITTDSKMNPFYGSLLQIPANISATDSIRITNEYSEYIESELIPTFTEMKDFLEKEYLLNGQSEDGLSAIEGGSEQYQYLIKYWTTTDLTADEVHEKGLKEVARITDEMDSIQKSVGYEGTLQEFFNYINTDPQFFPFNTIDEVIQRHYQTLKTMKPYVDDMFGIQPTTAFEIRPVDPAIANAATANYDGPNLEGTRPGIFYDAIPDAKKYNSISMEALFLHEAIPGHHFQIALKMENDDMPLFRRASGFGAFSEGWGLYCESLGTELGLYTDPYQYMGRLQAEMLRAARLVVDTGLHHKGWTREEAIAYFRSVMPISEASAIVHIERYMVRPGQALSYKIGELKIKELRDKVSKSLGEKFSLKDFHDLILTGGSIPLVNLENKVNDWIQSYQ